MKNCIKVTPRFLFLAVFLGLAAIPARTQPNWSVVSTDYEFTMTVTGIANIDCIESLDTSDIVAAFIGDEVHGVQPVREFYNGHNFAFMIVYDNVFSGNTIHFKMYDASEDRIIDLLGGMTFQENQNVGSTEIPHVFRNEPGINQILLSNQSIPLESQSGNLITTLTALNETGDATDVEYYWIDDTAGADNELFTLNGDQLLLNENATEIQDDTLDLHLRAVPQSGCSLDYAFQLQVVDPSTAVGNMVSNKKLLVFPNPTDGIIHWNESSTFDYLMVSDLQGKFTYQTQLNSETNVDLGFLIPGTYVIRLVGHDVSETGMVMKK